MAHMFPEPGTIFSEPTTQTLFRVIGVAAPSPHYDLNLEKYLVVEKIHATGASASALLLLISGKEYDESVSPRPPQWIRQDQPYSSRLAVKEEN